MFAAGDIRVTADQLLTADMITGTLGAAGVAGVGAGVAGAVTYADVAALVGENATLEAGGDVVVEATSASAQQDQQTEQAQSVTKGLAKELGENLATYGVRALSVTAGGGLCGRVGFGGGHRPGRRAARGADGQRPFCAKCLHPRGHAP